MNLIAAVSRNWGIGNEGKLLFNLSGDLRRFRTLTEGNHVIMGRKTLESLPGGRPLAGRNNIVLSRTLDAGTPGVTVCRDVAELKQLTKKIPTDKLFVIGGGEIYRLLEPLCSYAYITWVDDAPPADAFFPNLDESEHWRMAEETQTMENKGYIFQFFTYERPPYFKRG